jgi:PBP1b-binding outer membrane lipoprotein LpoB
MRTLASATVLLGVILLAGCTTASTPTAAPTPSATATPTPTPLTEPEEVAKQTTTAVSLYSQMVCTNLEERPDVDLNAAVDKVLATYATENLSEEARVQLAHNVLEESAAKDCPEQTDRITDALNAE